MSRLHWSASQASASSASGRRSRRCRLRRAAGRTFHSLRSRGFRLYFGGQVISAAGSWMQSVAQAWLVLRLTGSGVAIGFTLALQFTPILLGGAWSGVLVDRLDKRRLLVVTAAASALLAGVLGVLTATGAVEVWMVYVLAFLLGCVTAIDNPARRAFVPELVPRRDIANAVGLNSAVFTGARIAGPAIAGLLIAGFGIAWCFLLNAVSFVAVIAAFTRMRPDEIRAAPTVPRGRKQLRDGLRYAWENRDVRLALVMVGVISTVAFNYQVVLPVLARREFGADAATFGTLMAVMGAGSLAGALFAAHHGRASRRLMIWSALALGVAMIAASAAPTLALELVALVPMGAATMLFLAMATALCNEATAPELRGRVMALFAVAFLGSTPIGGPILGLVTESLGPRAGLALGAVTALSTGLAAWAFVRRAHHSVPLRALPVEVGTRAA